MSDVETMSQHDLMSQVHYERQRRKAIRARIQSELDALAVSKRNEAALSDQIRKLELPKKEAKALRKQAHLDRIEAKIYKLRDQHVRTYDARMWALNVEHTRCRYGWGDDYVQV